jgi:hypothetical protein
MPLSIEILPDNCQYALMIFNILPDRVGDMSGLWLGKDFSGLMDIMDIYEIEDKRSVFDLLLICIYEYSEFYEEKRKQQERRLK